MEVFLVAFNFENAMNSPVIGRKALCGSNLFNAEESKVLNVGQSWARVLHEHAIKTTSRFKSSGKLKETRKGKT